MSEKLSSAATAFLNDIYVVLERHHATLSVDALPQEDGTLSDPSIVVILPEEEFLLPLPDGVMTQYHLNHTIRRYGAND